MDSAEKLSYSLGFVDCWMLFKKAQNDPQANLKAAYIFEKLIPILGPSWKDPQVMELIDEAREENIMKKIEIIIRTKKSQDEMIKELNKSKIHGGLFNNG